MKASTFSGFQKAFILKQGADGMPVADICRKAGIRACHCVGRKPGGVPWQVPEWVPHTASNGLETGGYALGTTLVFGLRGVFPRREKRERCV